VPYWPLAYLLHLGELCCPQALFGGLLPCGKLRVLKVIVGIISVRPVALRVGRWLLFAAVLFDNYYLGALSVVAPLVPVRRAIRPTSDGR
jgi:hypothetical protein